MRLNRNSLFKLKMISPKSDIMKQPKLRTGLWVYILLLSTSLSISAQEINEPSLRFTLTEIMNDAESYQEYKVIKTSKLQQFKLAMIDSINAYQRQIKNLALASVETQAELKILKNELELIKSSLESSEAQNAQIGFLGLTFNKRFYNALVWSLIALLSTIVVVIYTRIKHVCNVVKRVKSAYSKIVDEYRNQRFQATEKQMLLKRELQTALNRLESLEAVEK
ncbi:hypothetical protein BFP71_12510 [Roseivirga misakiensis]|uniref:tRNA (Guanine-N1)-methyltransferase n=2 Tax=Roseivirga misakiensis TaxID=1563681 RepID=A0A1E5SYU2_9BACT|nr:hypothetical protein BFP71_12510 [Roseivirga misakiensis]